MERNPRKNEQSEAPNETPDDDTEKKPTKKSKSLAHLPSAAIIEDKPKPTASESFIESVEKAEPLHESDLTAEDIADVEALAEPTAEEIQYVYQQIADEHLQLVEPIEDQADIESQPDALFLQEVRDGQDPEVAFAHIASEHGMHEDDIATALDEEPVAAAPPPPPLPPTPTERAPQPQPENDGPQPLPTSPISLERPPRAEPQPTVSAENSAATRRNQAGQLLLVGIVGYLYGRRKGRIKSEKKLLPVKKRLEQRVVTLEQDISHKEQQLRVLVAKSKSAEQATTAPSPAERVIPAAPTEQRMQPGRRETRLGMEKPVRAEQLGHMVIAAEAPRAANRAEAPVLTRQQASKAEAVKTMPRAELLATSEKIVIEGASLRRIYESNLIGEKQLRHLVSEHLQGKDITKDLRKEMVEREIDFERDPQMRDRVRSALSASGGGLSGLLAKAGVVDDDHSEELERRVQKETERRLAQERKRHQQRVFADSAMVTAVIVLAVAVVILALTR